MKLLNLKILKIKDLSKKNLRHCSNSIEKRRIAFLRIKIRLIILKDLAKKYKVEILKKKSNYKKEIIQYNQKKIQK